MSSDVAKPDATAAAVTEARVLAIGAFEHHVSASAKIEHVAAPIDARTAVEALEHGPRGALVLASVSVGLLFIGWLLFYFVLFIPRGPVG